MNRIMKRMAIPVGAAIILGSSGFAFMASNSVPATSAGEGTGAVVGYGVSNVHYELGYSGGVGANRIDAVTFVLNTAASHVDAFISSQSKTDVLREYRNCSTTNGGTAWRCIPDGDAPGAGSGANLDGAMNLTVSAVQ
jgi:hypothetical protein